MANEEAAKQLDQRVAELEKRVEGLTVVAKGQAAMIALLTAILVDRGSLTREDAAVILTGGIDGQQMPGGPEAIAEWGRKEIVKRGQARSDRRPPAPRG